MGQKYQHLKTRGIIINLDDDNYILWGPKLKLLNVSLSFGWYAVLSGMSAVQNYSLSSSNLNSNHFLRDTHGKRSLAAYQGTKYELNYVLSYPERIGNSTRARCLPPKHGGFEIHIVNYMEGTKG